jgi:ribonuclease HI
MSYETIFLYFDGSYSSKTKLAGSCAYIENDSTIIQSKVVGAQTNNRAELTGLICGLEHCIKLQLHHKIKIINVFGDSLWVMNSILGIWKAKKNLDLLKVLYKNCIKLKDSNVKINFYHVKGHSGIIGNEICDKYSKLKS